MPVDASVEPGACAGWRAEAGLKEEDEMNAAGSIWRNGVMAVVLCFAGGLLVVCLVAKDCGIVYLGWLASHFFVMMWIT